MYNALNQMEHRASYAYRLAEWT